MASTLTNLLYHVVFSTKERRNIIDNSFRENLYKYIEHQEEHHRKQTFKEELISLLEKNNIEYNERYLWN